MDIFHRNGAVVRGVWPVALPELSKAGWKFCMESNEPDSIILFGPRWQEVIEEREAGNTTQEWP